MGEYAEMSIEAGFNDYIDDIDGYYWEYDFDDIYGYPTIRTYHPARFKPIHDYPEGDSVVLKRTGFTYVCIIVKKTEKAILFRVDRSVETSLDHDILFWLPKSVLYMKDDDKVYWIKDWATITNIAK